MNISLARLNGKSQAVLNDKCLLMLYRTENMGIAERIRYLRENQKPKKLSQEAFGLLCGVSKSAVSQWESGETEPDMKTILKLRDEIVFSLDWLLSGEGPKGFGDDIQRTLTLTDEQLDFLDLVNGIKPEAREDWMKLGKSLPKVENNNENKVEAADKPLVESGNKHKKMPTGSTPGFQHRPNNQNSDKRKTK